MPGGIAALTGVSPALVLSDGGGAEAAAGLSDIAHQPKCSEVVKLSMPTIFAGDYEHGHVRRWRYGVKDVLRQELRGNRSSRVIERAQGESPHVGILVRLFTDRA